MAAPAMSSGRPMRRSGALRRDLVAEGLERGRHHLGLERPGCDGVDRDAGREALGQVAGELMHGRLGGRVGVGLERRHLDPVDGADVDHPGRRLLAACLLEQREHELRHVEDALHVEAEHPLEGGLVVVGQGGAPGGTRVVDQDVELVDPRRHLLAQAAALLLLGQVRRDGHTRPLLRELVRHLLADLRLARGDVDRRPGVDEALGDHPADAAAAAGHECGLAVDGEEVRGAHGVILARGGAGSPIRPVLLPASPPPSVSPPPHGPTSSRSPGPTTP